MPPTSPTLSVGTLQPLIQESLPWSPLDFVRGISTAGDRAVYFASILRDLDPANDLRITCAIAADRDVAVVAERLPWDSSFFGYDVARLHGVFPLQPGGYRADADYLPALSALIQLARSRGIRYLFGVLDARDLPTLRALTASGFMLIETRIYFHRSLRSYHYRRRYGCRPATAADLDGLMALAQSVENPYDRFNSDPFIGREAARRLIATWIRASVVGGFADATLIPDRPNPGALCTLKYHTGNADAWGTTIGQMVLALAAPRADNRLVALIAEANHHLKDRGIEHVLFTTQITNRRAIRVSEHLGFAYGRGEYVFRLLL
jgi:dTDP-4-amino-4,6-dideoxy-D-galactose acyltransferase